MFLRVLAAAAALAALAGCGSGPSPDPPPRVATRAEADARFLSAKGPGDFRAAAELYQGLHDRAPAPQRGELLLHVGKCRFAAGEMDAALQAYSGVLERDGSAELRVEAYYRRGLVHNALWKPESALADFRRVQQAPKEVRDRAIKEPEFLLRLGITLQRTGLWAEGRRHLEQLAKDHPSGDEAGQARERIPLKSYRVQVGTCSDERTGAQRVAEAARKGIRAEVVPSAAVPGRRLVLVGQYAHFDDAVRELERLRALGYADAFPIP